MDSNGIEIATSERESAIIICNGFYKAQVAHQLSNLPNISPTILQLKQLSLQITIKTLRQLRTTAHNNNAYVISKTINHKLLQFTLITHTNCNLLHENVPTYFPLTKWSEFIDHKMEYPCTIIINYKYTGTHSCENNWSLPEQCKVQRSNTLK